MRKIYKDNKLIEVQLSRSEQLYLMKKNIAMLKELKNKEVLDALTALGQLESWDY